MRNLRIKTVFIDMDETLAQLPPNYIRFVISPQVANASQEAAHIGDRYDHDVVGARAAGLHMVLLGRESRHPDVDCPEAPDLREGAIPIQHGHL